MLRTKRFLFCLVWIAMGVGAQAEEKIDEPVDMTERPARTSSRDLKIPHELVQTIEKEYREFLTKNEVSLKENIKRQLLNLSVELTQKHPRALHEDVRVMTPLGGGVIDLADFVTPLRGAFALKIVPRREDGTLPAEPRVFFVSKTKPRIIDGETYGAGCGKYMEITSYFQRKNTRGFDLYTADQRYVSVVGGTFVVFAFAREGLMVGSLSLTDSRYPGLFCE